MERYRQQMKKGVLDLVVLAAVAQKPTYGYELLSGLDARSGGLFRLKEGTLYPVLYRLEDDGLIEASWQAGQGRATPKKYYAVTEKGTRHLVALTALWGEFAACVNDLLAPPPDGQTEPTQAKQTKEVGA